MRRRPLGGPQLGSLIGAVAGTLFILINAGDTGAAAVPIRVGGLVLFVVALTWGVLRSPESPGMVLSPHAGRIYRICVVAEIVAIPVGAAVINNVVDQPELTVLWVVGVVGLHFVPFSRAFGAPLYGWLGASMILLAVVGAVVTIASGSGSAPSWFAVAAGVVLLGFSVAGPRLSSANASAPRPTGMRGQTLSP